MAIYEIEPHESLSLGRLRDTVEAGSPADAIEYWAGGERVIDSGYGRDAEGKWHKFMIEQRGLLYAFKVREMAE